MTAPDRLSPLSSYDFFAWLTVTRPPLMEGLFGAPYGVATREVADRVGFRPAGAAETIGHYLAALQAFIGTPPPLTASDPLPIDFAGPEPEAAHPGDPWPYHLCMPDVEWHAPLCGEALMHPVLSGLHGASLVEYVVDYFEVPVAPRAALPPFVPAFEAAPVPVRSAVLRWLVAAAVALGLAVAASRLPPPSVNPPPLP